MVTEGPEKLTKAQYVEAQTFGKVLAFPSTGVEDSLALSKSCYNSIVGRVLADPLVRVRCQVLKTSGEVWDGYVCQFTAG